jgi:hypothetical protein
VTNTLSYLDLSSATNKKNIYNIGPLPLGLYPSVKVDPFEKWRHDTQHNNIRQKDTQYNNEKHDPHYEIQLEGF